MNRRRNHEVQAALQELRQSAAAAARITAVGQLVERWDGDRHVAAVVAAMPEKDRDSGLWYVRLAGCAAPTDCRWLLVPATSTLLWHDAAAEKPDDSTTVLVGFADGESESGFFDSEFGCWRAVSADRFEDAVVAWADAPEVPACFRQKGAVA